MFNAKLALVLVLGALGGATVVQPARASDVCDACSSAVEAGDIVGAARAAAKCSDATKKAACTKKVRRTAPRAAQAAVFNGQCGKARAIVAAAQRIGAHSNSLKRAVASCK